MEIDIGGGVLALHDVLERTHLIYAVLLHIAERWHIHLSAAIEDIATAVAGICRTIFVRHAPVGSLIQRFPVLDDMAQFFLYPFLFLVHYRYFLYFVGLGLEKYCVSQ